MMTVYIAGKFRAPTPEGIACNVAKAEAMALEVARVGLVPLCPHTMYRNNQGALPDEFWLKATLELMYLCDYVLMLPDWEESEGAKGEKAEAEKRFIKVFLSLEDLTAYLDTE